MLEELLAAEVLEVRVLHPAIAQSLVGKVVSVLEDRQPRHQPRRQRRLARLVGVHRTKLLFQKTPVERTCSLRPSTPVTNTLAKRRSEWAPAVNAKAPLTSSACSAESDGSAS